MYLILLKINIWVGFFESTVLLKTNRGICGRMPVKIFFGGFVMRKTKLGLGLLALILYESSKL
jgi:hypothetical protein